jgi:hypothetical protein
MQAFNAAVDTDPEEGGIYGDVIAFLVTRGHGPEALDAYHRVMGRPEITEYLKAYTSLWMIDLARLTGGKPDPTAVEFLGNLAAGKKWYQHLARFKLGKMTWEELVAHADTRGKRAEAWFYQATALYAAGDRAGAESLLRGVVETKMLGFFEYDMARHYLVNGPPGSPATARKN